MKIKDFVYELPDDIHGILAWKLFRFSMTNADIVSIVADYTWKDQIVTLKNKINIFTNKHSVFSKENDGFHAYPLTCFENFITTSPLPVFYVIGLVELRGRVIRHSDNVLRSSWMKILFLNDFSHSVNRYSIKNVQMYKKSSDYFFNFIKALSEVKINEIKSPVDFKREVEYSSDRIDSFKFPVYKGVSTGRISSCDTSNIDIITVNVPELENKIIEQYHSIQQNYHISQSNFHIILNTYQAKALELFYKNPPSSNSYYNISYIRTYMGMPIIVSDIEKDTPKVI